MSPRTSLPARRRRRAALPVLLALLSAPVAAQEAVPAERIAAEGGGVLYRYACGETIQRVLVVRGSAREMGLAHGRLLREEVRQSVRAFLDEWAIGRMGRSRGELSAIWTSLAPHIPPRYHEELAALAEGSGVPLDDLRLVHAIPSRYHCTGAAALPSVTRDEKTYHTRSLDYALDIGDRVRPQTNSLLLVAVPDDGIAHAVVTWAGFLGCVTGMNLAGLSVGEMGSRSSDESFDGFPMVFRLRETLRSARDVGEAKECWRGGPRTCGYNFLFADASTAVAVECNRSRIAFFGPGDPAENVEPHAAIAGIVRRSNHFVDPGLASTQRDPYDPRRSAASSWTAYAQQGDFLRERRGEIDAETMIALLRGYPPTHACLHQAVLCPGDATLWISQATDPATDPLPGAQNQPFFRYDLRSLVRGAGPPAAALRYGAKRSPPEAGAETGLVDGERAIEGPLGHAPSAFAWRLEPLRSLGPTTIHRLTFPSPGPSEHPENLTVHAEYYRPGGEGPHASAIVLDILDGRAHVARLLATALAAKGVAALYLKLPYYGERRPAQMDFAAIDLPDAVAALTQAVRDVRRGAAWLRSRRELDRDRVGIVGVSLGSFVAQVAAGADGSFHRCCFVLGGGSIADAIYSGGRETRAAAALLEARGWTRERVAALLDPVEPLSQAKGIARESVLMLNCREDEVVPRDSVVRYWEALGRPEIIWYDGNHYGMKDHIFDVLGRITAHLAKPGGS